MVGILKMEDPNIEIYIFSIVILEISNKNHFDLLIFILEASTELCFTFPSDQFSILPNKKN